MGDEALDIVTTCWYSASSKPSRTRPSRRLFRKEFKYDPGFYAASTYVNGAVLEAAVKAVNGKVEDRPALMAALRATNVDTARGTCQFDDLGNVVGNVYLRKVTRKDGRSSIRCSKPIPTSVNSGLTEGSFPRQPGLLARVFLRPNIWRK